MWSLTPYDRCDFRCVYCCTNVQGSSKPTVPPAEYAGALRARLDAVPPGELIIVGAFCDAYPPPEEQLGITRTALEELIARKRRFVIVTKGTAVLRDSDLLVRHQPHCKVQISICTADDAVGLRLDPAAPPISRRFAVLYELRERGVEVNLNLLPWIPGVTQTAELIARTPPAVDMTIAPLTFGPNRDRMQLLGRWYVRGEVWESYFDEYRRYGHVPNTSWVRPSPPPTENDPMYRLPVLRSPAGLNAHTAADAREPARCAGER